MLQVKRIDGEVLNYNFSCKFSELPKPLQDMCKYLNRDFNNYCSLQGNSIIYFVVERDYYYGVEMYHKHIDSDEINSLLSTHYFNINMTNKKVSCEFRFIDDKNINSKYTKEVEDFINNKFNGNIEVCRDYDYEQVMEAIELGDVDLLDDIVGDRDLLEII